MYKPTGPITVELNDGEDRPAFAGAMLAGRVHGVAIPEGKYRAQETPDGQITAYWVPDDE